MLHRNVKETLIFPIPSDEVLDMQMINKIVNYTVDTMSKRDMEKKLQDAVQGKKAEYVIENYLKSKLSGVVEYLSYDEFRADSFEKHAPFDGLLYKVSVPTSTISSLIAEINSEISNDEYGRISLSLRQKLNENGVFTLEIKSSLLRDRNKDYEGVSDTQSRTINDYLTIVDNILKRWEFFCFPHFMRNTREQISVNSFAEYVSWVWKNTSSYADVSTFDEAVNQIVLDEFQNSSDIFTRVFYDYKTSEIYVPGYMLKHHFFIGVPTITRMDSDVSRKTLYFTRSIQHYRNPFSFIAMDKNLWLYDYETVKNSLYRSNCELCCPRCGCILKEREANYICENNCGISLHFLFGLHLSKEQVTELLRGKMIKINKNGETKTIYPYCKYNYYEAKDQISYVWVMKW